jgi:hypothetical protein
VHRFSKAERPATMSSLAGNLRAVIRYVFLWPNFGPNSPLALGMLGIVMIGTYWFNLLKLKHSAVIQKRQQQT